MLTCFPLTKVSCNVFNLETIVSALLQQMVFICKISNVFVDFYNDVSQNPISHLKFQCCSSLITPRISYVTQLEYFLNRVSTNEIDWTLFTRLSKISAYFTDRGGRVRFVGVYASVIQSTIASRQNYVHQNFCLKKTFPEICNKTFHPIWKFKVSPIYSVTVGGGGFLKNIKYIFF